MAKQKVTEEEALLLATNHRLFIRRSILTYAKITISSMAFVGIVYLVAILLGASGSTGGAIMALVFTVMAIITWCLMIAYWLYGLFVLNKKIVEEEKELNTYEVIE